MGSVISSLRLSRKKRIYLGIFVMYFAASFVFITVGLQPASSTEAAYASEAEQATEQLDIPAIGLSAPVKPSALKGSDLEVPEQIVGAYSVNHNKTFLFGHSSTIFQNLKDLELSDTFTYANKTYNIISITEHEKSDISMKDILASAEQDTVIIMTCSGNSIPNSNGDHTHRLIITAIAK